MQWFKHSDAKVASSSSDKSSSDKNNNNNNLQLANMFGNGIPRIFNNKQPSDQQQQQHNSQHRSNFKGALEHISVPEVFHRGINVFKVTSKGKLEAATLLLSKDKFIISVLPRSLKLERVGSSTSSSTRTSLKRPGILSRARSSTNTSLGTSTRNTSYGSVGTSGSIGTNNSVDGLDSTFSFMSVDAEKVDIGSITRISNGQNTLLFEKARYVHVVMCPYLICVAML